MSDWVYNMIKEKKVKALIVIYFIPPITTALNLDSVNELAYL